MSLRVLGSGKQCSKLMIHSLIVRALTAARSSTRWRPWEINSGDESWRRPRVRIAGVGRGWEATADEGRMGGQC